MPANSMRVRADVRSVHHVLSNTYSQAGVHIWLHSRNRNLSMQRPIDLIESGRGSVALEEAKRIAGQDIPTTEESSE